MRSDPRVKFQQVGCHSLQTSLEGPEDLLLMGPEVRARKDLREHLAQATHFTHREAEAQRLNVICSSQGEL